MHARGPSQRHVLMACVDSLWIQKYVSVFSCGRKGKKEEYKFNKEVPAWSLENVLNNLIIFDMEACQKLDMTPCQHHLKWQLLFMVHCVYICIHPFFSKKNHVQINVCTFWQLWKCALRFAVYACLNMIMHVINFQKKLHKGQRNVNLLRIYHFC